MTSVDSIALIPSRVIPTEMENGSLGRVTVIIPCHNAARWIRETLGSVRDQADVAETIVVDDGSTDDSASIVAREFPAVQLIRTANCGASHARNTGTQAASGDLIQYLDADDLLTPGKINVQIKALTEAGADVAYGDWQRLVQRIPSEFVPGEIVAREMRQQPEIELFTDFWCPPAAYLFRRSIINSVGGWNENLPIIQDARFVLDCALRGAQFVYCPGVMAMYRVHGNDSLSRRDSVAFVRDIHNNACEVEQWWRQDDVLSEERRKALIRCYGYVARASYEKDRDGFEQAYAALTRLCDRYIPEGPAHLAIAARLMGYPRAEAVALAYRRAKNRLGIGSA
jgi:glycosyltransferase involved in cell wall biosynthesis